MVSANKPIQNYSKLQKSTQNYQDILIANIKQDFVFTINFIDFDIFFVQLDF